MSVRRILALISVLALCLGVAATSVSAQDDSKGQQPTETTGGAGGAALDVIPGVETQGNGNTYVLLDSTDAGGPTLNSPVYAPATVAATLSDDDFEQVNLGFAFEFYGAAHASVFIGSNGYLAFNNGNSSPSNGDLATQPVVTDPAIFAFFDDLYVADPTDPGGGGEVRYGTFGPAGRRVFVVEFDDVFRFGPETSGGTFQIRLFETTNVIEFHYFDVVWGAADIDFGAGATVGIRAGAAGSAFLQYLANSAQIDNGLAIRLWQPTCAGQAPTIVGDRGVDLINGTPGPDVIYGHQGNDLINGFGGADTICAAGGNDLVNGGTGVDTLFGQSGLDTLNGDGGADTIFGGHGSDTVRGSSGDDTILGGSGNDTIDGGAGFDLINGQGGDDTIDGGDQGDEIYGADGDDTIDGGPGWDTLRGNGGNDTIRGGDGNDNINGGDGADTLLGEGGHDLLVAWTGNDVADGGPGHDRINGQSGNDQIDGGDGNDQLWGSIGDDVINGDAGFDWIWGGWGSDQLSGGDQGDRIYGEGHDDTLNGDNGWDLLSGGFGFDTCNGGQGTDTANTCESLSSVP